MMNFEPAEESPFAQDIQQREGDRDQQPSGDYVLRSTKHPAAVFCHVFWKLAALIAYLFFYLFYNNFVIIFIIVVIFVAFDFWTTKNVTGRLLVGLRWWNEIREDGSNRWIFECLEDNKKYRVNQMESVVFWVGLFLTPILWCIFFVTALLRIPPQLDWMVIVVIAICLSCANICGYIKCARSSRKKIQRAAAKFAAKQMVEQGVKSQFGSEDSV